MGDLPQKKMIESEMDRFEKEISSLGVLPPPPPTKSFIPAQLRRPGPPLAPPGTAPMLRPNIGSNNANFTPCPPKPSPSPIIISGAPQVYNASAKLSISIKPVLAQSSSVSSSSTSSIKPSVSLSASGSSSSLPLPNSTLNQGQGDVKPSTSGTSGSSLTDAMAAMKKKKKKKKKTQDGEEKKPKKILRSAGGQVWEDTTLLDWDSSDFRLFCGDLGNDVTDEVLTRVFGRFPSFQKAKVVRDKRTNKTKGFGFVSFKDPNDFVRAIKELDGRYVGSRPIKLRKSNWRHRNLDQARKKEKERTQIMALIKK